jgi:hypothetical protein
MLAEQQASSEDKTMPVTRIATYVMGIEGLALLRHWLSDDQEGNTQRVTELTHLANRVSSGAELEIPALDVAEGYRAWAGTYDSLPNPLVDIEQPVVRQ